MRIFLEKSCGNTGWSLESIILPALHRKARSETVISARERKSLKSRLKKSKQDSRAQNLIEVGEGPSADILHMS